MIELKSFKKWSICRQAQLCRSNGLKVTEVWSWCPKNLLGKKLTLATKKSNCLFVSVSHPSNEKNIAKSMTILKLCKRSFKWDLAGCPSSICLEMAYRVFNYGWLILNRWCASHGHHSVFFFFSSFSILFDVFCIKISRVYVD